MYSVLKKARIQAMKDKNEIAKSLFSTMLGDIDKVAKDKQVEPDNALVGKVAKKLTASAKENIALYEQRGLDASKEKVELELLSTFLPSFLSEDETSKIVSEFIKSDSAPNIGKVMGFLKKNYGGTVDMGIASKVAKGLL